MTETENWIVWIVHENDAAQNDAVLLTIRPAPHLRLRLLLGRGPRSLRIRPPLTDSSEEQEAQDVVHVVLDVRQKSGQESERGEKGAKYPGGFK